MNDEPKRIWASSSSGTDWSIYVKCVRADIVDALVEALKNPVCSDDGFYDYHQHLIDDALEAYNEAMK